MRILNLLLLLVLIILQYRLWFGQLSITDYLRQQDEIITQQNSNQELARRNRLLLADVNDLRQGMEAIEERARNELGLIAEDEVFFRLIPQDTP